MTRLPSHDHTYRDVFGTRLPNDVIVAHWTRTCACGWLIRVYADVNSVEPLVLLESKYQTHLLALIAHKVDQIEAGAVAGWEAS